MPREREVMLRTASRRLNKQIAGELALSVVTVKVHRAQVMRKMLAKSVVDLARMADQLGVSRATLAMPRVARCDVMGVGWLAD